MSRIRIVERTGSTNADIAADNDAVEGDWLVALNQDSGKGRQGRQWVSGSGNFFGSTLVQLRAEDPPAQTLSLAAGLALIEAIDIAMPAQAVTLKWPNDVMLLGRKLAGILLERSGDRVAVGFGVNLATAPVLTDRHAATLGGQISSQAFAPLLAGSFSNLLDIWRSSETVALARAWQQRAHPTGTRLTVHTGPEETVSGRFAGLEPDGALRLTLDDGSTEVVRAGDVDLN
ncbi:MAG TPA: biotin--[acetyl-CoA-carboxylase] ligase [Sphingomicrobium sp.]|nr:biotin--[acetyl-CoA-carboxylase] ligase [Sphingomicrobium sp.]